MASSPKKLAEIVEHLIDINGGRCRISEQDILGTRDPALAEILAGLLILHESLEYRAQQTRAQLEETQKARLAAEAALRSREQFLATMSHELRTPLEAILGPSDALQQHVYGALNPRQARALETIEQGGRALLALIDDMLDASLLSVDATELECQPVVPGELCRELVRMFRPTATAKRINLRTSDDGSCDRLTIDQVRIRQILSIFLSNALKFTPRGGSVTLAISARPREQMVAFEVSDTGPGIDAADLPNLFQAFVQLDGGLARMSEGRGLGLAIARQIAELHSATIEVQSVPDQGSRFALLLPLPMTTEHALPISSEPVEAQPKRGEGALILMVDDTLTNVAHVRDFLASQGYRVKLADSGANGLAMAWALRPALVLMDIQMPEMDGLEAIRRLRTDPRSRTMPIVALTALAMVGDRERCVAAGANDHLAKPCSLRALQSMIELYCGTPTRDESQ